MENIKEELNKLNGKTDSFTMNKKNIQASQSYATDSNKRKKFRIQKLNIKFLIGFIFLALIICAVSCTIGYTQYKTTVEKLYNDNAYRIAAVAASYVDGDTIERYYITNEIDSAYETMRLNLNNLRENMGVNYIYIAKVEESSAINFTYIFDADNPDDDFETMLLGEKGSFNNAFEKDVEQILLTGERSDNYFYSHSQFGYNSSALLPIRNSSSEITALLGVEIGLNLIQSTLNTYLIYAVTTTVCFVFLFLFIYLTYLNRSVINPLKNIAIHSSGFIESNTSLANEMKKINTGDEIETLAKALIKMEQDIYTYMQNISSATAEREHIAAELGVTKQIQHNLFPCVFPAFPERSDFDIFARINSAKTVGGSFYNFFFISKNKLCLFLGDVSGTGIPTAMFSVIAATLIKNYADMEYPPARILAEVNNQLSQNNKAELTVDVIVCIIDLANGEMVYSSSGDLCPLVKHSATAFEPLDYKKCFSLASMEQVPYSQQTVQLVQGDTLFFSSYGLANTTDNRGNLYGFSYVQMQINNIIKETYSLNEISDRLFAHIEQFQNGAEQEDDSCVVLFRYVGK